MINLKPGDKAPDFTSTDENGRVVKLSDYKGKKVVLYFYPKDDTPSCTAEACSLRDNYKAMQKAGYEILGVSSNTEKQHARFKAKYKLPFTLLADPDKNVHSLYGTWAEKQLYGRKYMGTLRTTFIINEKGIIEEVIEKVNTAYHALQVLGMEIPKKKKAATPKKAAPKKK
jgi:thioredoxin-dependent peroxiredoxin